MWTEKCYISEELGVQGCQIWRSHSTHTQISIGYPQLCIVDFCYWWEWEKVKKSTQNWYCEEDLRIPGIYSSWNIIIFGSIVVNIVVLPNLSWILSGKISPSNIIYLSLLVLVTQHCFTSSKLITEVEKTVLSVSKSDTWLHSRVEGSNLYIPLWIIQSRSNYS